MRLSLFLAIKTVLRGDKGSLILTILIMKVTTMTKEIERDEKS
jgi:hypothetical protein